MSLLSVSSPFCNPNAIVRKVQELLDIWHRLQQNAVDSAIDGECVFAPAYGPKRDILISDNMVKGLYHHHRHHLIITHDITCRRNSSTRTGYD